MKSKFEKQLARNVLAVSIAAIGLSAPFAAWADQSADEIRRLTRPESEVELGIGNISDSSYKFGNYTGMNDRGAYGIANISVIRRGEDDARYLEIVGRNLGLDSRNLRIEGGEQGNYDLRLGYSELPKLFSDSYQTPFVNPGNTRLTLPAGWIQSNTTAGMTNLTASMQPFKVETLRKSLSLGLTKLLPADWSVAFNYKRETKEGNRFIGATFGTGGGNPRAAVLPEPVDYTTDLFEALARYSTEKLQLQFAYHGSFFKNANNGLAWQNPYANAAGTTWGIAAVGYSGGGYGQLGLPPDNQAHQVSASAGYNYSKHTRVAGNLSFGRMTQNEAFLPYTINPGLTVTTPMPRSSLDGVVNTTHLDMKLTSKLMPKLNLTAAYRYDDRKNKTPQSQYLYIGGDSMNQPATLAVGQARTNLPGSSTKQLIDAELDYHVGAHTKLKLGYGYDWVKKTFEAIDSEREHTLKAGVDHHFGETTSGGLSYAYAQRRTSDYNGAAPVLASYSPQYMATIAANLRWDDLPGMKKFFMAARNRDKLRAFVNAAPSDRLDLQFGIDYNQDRYPDSEFGLKEANGWMFNFDANLRASDAVSGHLFATAEQYGTDQNSRAYSGGASKPTQSIDPNRNWSMSATDHTTTVGLGLRVKPGGKYEFGGDLSHVYSKGAIGFTQGTSLTSAPMPDLITRMNRLELFGRYEVKKDVSINVKYIHENYHSTDWAYDNVLPATMANVIGTNQTSPDYNVNAIGVSVSYKFQ